MDIRGESIQNGEPTPEHPVEIENKINLTGAIQILNKLKSKVNLVKADEKKYRLPYLISIEKQAIETVLSELEKQDNKIKELEGRCRNLDKEAQSYLEELMGDSTLKNRTIKQLNLELEKKDKEYEELTEASKELCKTVNLMKKVINEMAEYIIDLIKYNNSEEERDKEEIKEYFTKKAEKGE